jgi:hypothetical protein
MAEGSATEVANETIVGCECNGRPTDRPSFDAPFSPSARGGATQDALCGLDVRYHKEGSLN